jgi:hypothetical protein
MYTCHCHNTKHVRPTLLQYKTCTGVTVTTQNMYECHCQNKKHIRPTLSQYKTCTSVTVTIQNMYAQHCYNTKQVRVSLSQHKTCTRATGCCKHYCLLLGQWSSGMFRCGNIKFRGCCFSNLRWLDDRGESISVFGQWNGIFVYILCFSLRFNVLQTISVVKLTLINFSY